MNEAVGPRAARPALEHGRVLWWPHRLDFSALEACAEALMGTHDFTAFTPTETDHVRFRRSILGARWIAVPPASSFPRVPEESSRDRHSLPLPGAGGWSAPGDVGVIWEFWIQADAFMRSMVRVLVGTMLEVAAGRREQDEFLCLLEGAPRSEAGETAAAHGLYLASVSY